MSCEHKICGSTQKVWLPFEPRGQMKGLKPHLYCLKCGFIKNISSDRARPIGYFMNVLSHLSIAKVQTRMIAKELENIAAFDDVFSISEFTQEQIFIDAVRKYSNLAESTIRAAL
jgi:hypothetical protein